MMRIIGVGDNTIDRYLHLGKLFPGGNALNVAVMARRHGYPASYIGRYGFDEYGQFLADVLQAEGVDISHCQQVDGPTARGDVSVIDGDRVFGQSNQGVSAEITLTESDYCFISRHHLAHTSIHSHLERQIPRLSNAAPKLSFDFSQNWDRKYLSEMMPWIDVAILSYPDRNEADTESLLRWVAGQGPEIVLVTQGEAGATAYDGQRLYRQGIVETQVVDTLGAGDAFVARFLVEYLGGTPIDIALSMAVQSAAETCGHFGGFGYGRTIQTEEI